VNATTGGGGGGEAVPLETPQMPKRPQDATPVVASTQSLDVEGQDTVRYLQAISGTGRTS
jgi:hypothetical protein